MVICSKIEFRIFDYIPMRVECDMPGPHHRGLRRFFIYVSGCDLYQAKSYTYDVDGINSDHYSIDRHRACAEPWDIF